MALGRASGGLQFSSGKAVLMKSVRVASPLPIGETLIFTPTTLSRGEGPGHLVLPFIPMLPSAGENQNCSFWRELWKGADWGPSLKLGCAAAQSLAGIQDADTRQALGPEVTIGVQRFS